MEQANQTIKSVSGSLAGLNEAHEQLNNVQRAVKQWFGLNEVINLTKKIVRDAITELRELDSVMTEIAVVTDMTQADLWAQMGTYGAIAEQYGVSTRGVYEVSQLWYQQGLQTAEVMDLTTETLKMAKIANLDYATATDYMTVALRGFKLEMSEAQNVTDVYSALAAATASDTEELAIAMSKTASSAEAVGASFESTSAMIATMISITREAPENIGSALKSIISRYGEMTSDPLKLVDSEGEEMSLNKVDKALKSVGISLQDANGKFRAFDDVILELAESWNTIDTNTQRYIATIMAGNRQQSRFLALVGNVDAYKEALETAADAEDAGTLQYLKTMDSLETKLQQVKTAWTQFYSSMGLEELFKGALDIITNIIQSINKMNKIDALMNIGSIFMGLKNAVSVIFGFATKKIGNLINHFKEARAEFERKIEIQLQTDEALKEIKKINEAIDEATRPRELEINTTEPKQTLQTFGFDATKIVAEKNRFNGKKDLTSFLNYFRVNEQDFRNDFTNLLKGNNLEKFANNFNLTAKDLSILQAAIKEMGDVSLESKEDLEKLIVKIDQLDEGKFFDIDEKKLSTPKISLWKEHADSISTLLSVSGAAISAFALTVKDTSDSAREASKIWAGVGTGLSSLGSSLMTMVSGGFSIPAIVAGIVVALPGLISGINQVFDGLEITTEERISMLKEEFTELENAATVKKGETLNLKNALNEYYELKEAQYDSAESAQAFTDKMNAMGEQYPQLIASMDASGNAIIDAQAAEQLLTEARYASAQATLQMLETEYELKKEQNKKIQEASNEWNDFSLNALSMSRTVAENSLMSGIELNESQIQALNLFDSSSNPFITTSETTSFLGFNRTYSALTEAGANFVTEILNRYADQGIEALTDAELQIAHEMRDYIDVSFDEYQTFDLQEISLNELDQLQGQDLQAFIQQVESTAKQLNITDQIESFNIETNIRGLYDAIQYIELYISGQLDSTE